MKSIALLCFIALFAAPSSFAQPDSSQTARALLTRLKAKKPKAILAAPLLNFSLSPEAPAQNQNISVFIQPDNTFPGREISIDMKVNGVTQSLAKPAKNLWVLPLGLLTETKSYQLEATLFIENSQDNLDVREAVKALDRDINRLTNQINGERDPSKRKILQAQRAEKIALKTELLEQLKRFRVKVGTQNFAFTVQPNPADPTLPKINSLTPISGAVAGGTTVTFSGENYTANAVVLFGGVPAPTVTFVNENTLQAITPAFMTEGTKSVELRFSTPQGVRNVVASGAFFATDATGGPGGNIKPVAVAGGSQKIRLGQTANLDATESYDENNDALSYRWVFASVPADSNFTVGMEFSTNASPSFIPDVPGTFVAQLRVQETSTPEFLESDPSLAVVQVGGEPMPTAAPISVFIGNTETTQVFANNPQEGHANFFSITIAPQHGTATINANGLLSFTAPSDFAGNDSVTVRVTDQTGLFGTVVIPITITTDNVAPAPTAPTIAVVSGQSATSQVAANDPDAGQQHTYQITVEPTKGTASVSASGLVTYNSAAGSSGTDSLTVKVTDNGAPNLNGTVVISVSINRAPVPTASAITVATNATQFVLTFPNDPDPNDMHTYAITTPPILGTANVTATGRVNYTAGATAGSDSLTVQVTDNGNPMLSE